MNFKDFQFWKKQKKPKDIIEEYLGDLSMLSNNIAFQKYKEILEFKIHNQAERALFFPKKGTYDQGFADGQRSLLIDFKKIEEASKKRKEQTNGNK